MESEKIEIDASFGEGGGQIIRTALALSALTQKPIVLKNIRAKRPKPGLRPQHLASVKAIGALCNAKIENAFFASKELVFSPQKVSPQNFNVSIGTAGSISLLVSQLLPVSLLAEINLHVSGGTNVPFSPPIEFVKYVLFPILKKMGAKQSLSINRRGFFPKGNGLVSFTSKKARIPLRPIKIVELGSLEAVEIFSSCASLPKEVALNQARAAKNALKATIPEFVERIDYREKAETIGSSITLLASFSSGFILSGSALGKKGVPAEQVGKAAAHALLAELKAEKPCDSHLADQLIPFMALAKGKSEIVTTKLSQHCLTNILITEKFLPVKFAVEGELGKPAKISVKGAGFTLP